jgi:hypothetical protein
MLTKMLNFLITIFQYKKNTRKNNNIFYDKLY